MGQQTSNVGVQNLDALREHGATANVAEADYKHLSSRVEKLIKLAQFSLGSRVHDRSQSTRNTDVRQQLLQELSMISQDTLPQHFTDISAFDVSFERDKYDISVADVVCEPVGLYCHVPERNLRKVDMCNIDCQTADESHHNTIMAHKGFECLRTETSDAKREVFANDQVTVTENDVCQSKLSDDSHNIFLSRHELGIDAKSRFCDAEGHCRSRPPPSPKFITTPATVLQSANESRPAEIGSYLTVAPVVPSSDLGLSPIAETAEVAVTTPLLSQANTSDTDGCSEQTARNSWNHHTSLDAYSLGSDCTRLQFSIYLVHNSEVSYPENSAVSLFDDDTNFVHTPMKVETTLLQSDEGFVQTEGSKNVDLLRTANDALSDGKFSQDTSVFALEGRSDEIDKCFRIGIKNAAEVTTFGSWTLQDRDAVFSDTGVPQQAKSNIKVPYSSPSDGQYQLSENKLIAAASYPGLQSETHSSCSSQTSTPYFALTDTAQNISMNEDENKNKTEQCDVCSVCQVPELDACAAVHARSTVDTSAFDSVWTEWETALSCSDWSANNNQPTNFKTSRISMSPAAGPLTARRQVRHCSENSALLSSSLPSAGVSTSNSGGQYQPLPARSTSQLSLDDVIVSPRTVPERLDFQQLEKFEGGYSLVC